MTSTSIFPCLRYADAPAAIDWLERVLGARRGEVYADESGSIGHAEVWFGDVGVMLSSQPEPGSDRLTWGPGAACAYLAVDEVDDRYANAMAGGAEVVRELADTVYGSREFTVADPEGNLWNLGSYRPQPPSQAG